MCNLCSNFVDLHSETVYAGSSTLEAAKPAGSLAQLANYLTSGFWASVGAAPHQWAGGVITYNFGNLSAAEKILATNALMVWDDVANITFLEVSSGANINFNHNGSMQAFTSSNWNGSGFMTAATVDISSGWVNYYGTALDTYSFQTYIHEIGHAIGLGHQGPYNGSGSYGTSNAYANDTWQYSVMSYFSQANYGGSYRFVQTPMMADILAVQTMYGASTTTRLGDTVYGFNATAGSLFNFGLYSTAPAMTLYDSGGSDTLDASGYSVGQVIDLQPGSFSSIGGLTNNIGIATTTIVENAIGGAGNDRIYGNDANNLLVGGAGADYLDGRGGDNTVSYAASAAPILIDLAIGVGSSADAAGDVLVNIQNVIGTGSGDVLAGSAGANGLYGGSGNDWLIGRGGADLLDGGAGQNTAFYDGSTSVRVDLSLGTGLYGDAHGDSLLNIQNVTGSSYDDILIGDAAVNRLSGAAGNDWLVGGAGADVLDGGAGLDTIAYGMSTAVQVNLAVDAGLNGDAQGDILVGIENVYGSNFNDWLVGDDGANQFTGGYGGDWITGCGGDDIFVFTPGTGGDHLLDFTGNGAGAGDMLQFVGYGPGASFTQIDPTRWQVNYAGNSQHDLVTFENGAAIHLTDFVFV